VVVFLTGEAEEAGQGLGRFLAEVRVGAEGEPGSGHALEPAQRHVGHPREDLDDEVLREAGHALLLPRPPRHPICEWWGIGVVLLPHFFDGMGVLGSKIRWKRRASKLTSVAKLQTGWPP